ncbi:urease accessory protein UreJ [Methyloceanibacter marginalis]|uniref:Urease accessory protein UreJ n=1 Tax=Methyloceanibacter marginalis TaxID=1774971 RepID=A0A1E3WA98_9HYPH|nr:HupE/UreJ family protein [Methyloceanibacter marginalis]ODS02733.1 urease accessory protein UreJ [Methyloceanibacter marginalis]
MNVSLRRTAFLTIAGLLLTIEPALAHHAMGGEMPSTFGQGLLSGLAHPVIGLDHLAFLIAVGVAVGVGGLSLALPVAFVVASALGVVIHLFGFNLPGVELLVAASVVLIGALVASGRALPLAAWGACSASPGFSMAMPTASRLSAEATPLWAYLLGLVVIQSALSVGVALITRRAGEGVSAIAPRLAGAVVVGVGLAALLGQLIPEA